MSFLKPIKVQSYFLIATLFVTYACGQKKQSAAPAHSEPPRIFDKELQAYFDSYVMEAEARGVPVDKAALKELKQLVWSSEIPQGFSKSSIKLGRCLKLNYDNPDPKKRYRVVQITKPNEMQMVGPFKLDAITLRSVVYHELGHCLHNFDGHRPLEEDSIMSSSLPKTRSQRMEELVDEHFMLMGKKPIDNFKAF